MVSIQKRKSSRFECIALILNLLYLATVNLLSYKERNCEYGQDQRNHYSLTTTSGFHAVSTNYSNIESR